MVKPILAPKVTQAGLRSADGVTFPGIRNLRDSGEKSFSPYAVGNKVQLSVPREASQVKVVHGLL